MVFNVPLTGDLESPSCFLNEDSGRSSSGSASCVLDVLGTSSGLFAGGSSVGFVLEVEGTDGNSSDCTIPAIAASTLTWSSHRGSGATSMGVLVPPPIGIRSALSSTVSRVDSRLSPRDNSAFAASSSCSPLVIFASERFNTKSGKVSLVCMPVNVCSVSCPGSFVVCTPANVGGSCVSVDVIGVCDMESVVGMPENDVFAFGDPICLCAQSRLEDGSLFGQFTLRFRCLGLVGVSSSSPSFSDK